MEIHRPVQQTSKYLFALFFFIHFISFTPVFSQLNLNNLTRFTEADGVPGSQVSAVIADKFGYIWLGTMNGLARYDGYEFKRFYSSPNDPSSMKGMVIWSLFGDSKGRIWIGSYPGFLDMYNPVTKSFSHYDFYHFIKVPANVNVGVRTMCEDDKGRIYFGVLAEFNRQIQASSLLYFDEKSTKLQKFSVPDSIITNSIFKLINDHSGNIWFLSWNGIYRIDSKRKLTKIHIFDTILKKNNDFIQDLKPDTNGHLWIISILSNLYDYNPVDGTTKMYSSNLIQKNKYQDFGNKSIIFDKYNNIWIGTNTGLYFFDTKIKKFETFTNDSKKQLNKAMILDLEFDSFGTLWIGTVSDGLLKYEEKVILKSYTHIKDDKNSLTPGWVNSIYEAQNGKIWISSSGDGIPIGLNELDTQTGAIQTYSLETILPNTNVIFGLLEIQPNEFYISTEKGLYQYSPKLNTIKKIQLKGVSDSLLFIYHFFKDSRGNLWLCTNKGLYKKTKSNDSYKKYDLTKTKNGDLISNEISKAYESKKHGLWLVTNNGLFLYNYKTDKIKRYGYDKKAGDVFVTQDINSFYEDTTGTAWVGTWDGGLSKYNIETGKIKTYTRNDGLPSMSIQGILPDYENNCLWLSTFDGLSRFNMKSEKFNNYSIADGIQSQLFADGAYLKTSTGKFIFGGSNGITIFNANDVNIHSVPPKVFLTDLKLFNKSVLPGKNSILKNPIYNTKKVILSYNQNYISIEFTALHYSNPSKNRCIYKLDNYDKDWREDGNLHLATYPMLPPGKYVFHVKAANNNGVWNEKGASLQIVINPPWWKTIYAYILYLILFAIGVFGADRFFRNRVIKKERERSQAKELEQAKEIEKAYTELKDTQSQLIQAEKMASLGELTAGIAHEIQNPLNFVNNFSEVSTELLDEMKEELSKGNTEEAIALADDVKLNLEKISHHGKRADSIVKGMLQHSRTSTGLKEPTDINALADEFLRLAYHGLRAKDKSFNAKFESDFDESLSAGKDGSGKINVIAQDMGRVILNLLTNAFYAVAEKKKTAGEDFMPTVTVSTKRLPGKVEIRVKDNGDGIPQRIMDKIFNPFFTTKPAGQGTGLGLSLCYEIVTKGHGGELHVETKEGEGTVFIIHLPI